MRVRQDLERKGVVLIKGLNEIVQGRMREGKHTYTLSLDVQKAFDTVWHDGLWFKLWELGVRGRMWRVIKNMYDITQSAVLLEGEVSEQFNIGQGWHRVVVCRLSSFPFLLISC